MADSILIRIKRMITGGVADMVDALENAQGESVMREALREVERAIDEARAEVGRVASRRIFASRQVGMIRGKAAELSQKARLALGEGRTDIAEALVGRQIDLETQIPVIESAEYEARGEETELAQCLTALHARKREMEADLEAFASAQRAAGREAGNGMVRASAASANGVVKASEAFDRVMKSATSVSGLPIADREAASRLAEFDSMMRGRKIAERLAALQTAH
jgi:phage shock protein A